MRQHQIFNGIFKVECFERPSQPKEISSQMILQLSKLNVLTNLMKFYLNLIWF